MRILLFLFLVSFQASAVVWDDLEKGSSYKINTSFELKMMDRSGSHLSIMKDEKFVYRGFMPLSIPGAPMILYFFDYVNCPGMETTTDIEIVSVQDTEPMVKVGVQLEENCVLQVYVNGRDWRSNSLFE